MPQHQYDELLRALSKDQIAPVYYLFGPETVLREEAAVAILDRALPPEERAFNFEQRSATGLEPEELHSLLNALPMLGARRVVFLRGVEASKKKPSLRSVLLKYLANPSADTVLLLIETGGDKEKPDKADSELVARSFAIDFQPLKPDRVPRWLEHHAERLGITFGEGAVQHLTEATGYDLGTMRSELEKVASVPREGSVSLEEIEQLVGVRHGETPDDWRDAVLEGKTARAVQMLEPLLARSGMSGVKLVTMLGTALIGVSLARSLLERQRGSALERTLFSAIQRARLFGGNWSRMARQWSQWAERWTAPQLREAVRLTLAADQSLKETVISDEAGILTSLVLQIGGCSTAQLKDSSRRPGRTETAGV